MSISVFFSWQSDQGETRNVIWAALDRAVRNLNRDVALEEALRIDEDTAGLAGWPEIASAIRRARCGAVNGRAGASDGV